MGLIKVNIQVVKAVEWLTDATFKLDNTIHVWRIKINPDADYNELKNMLNPDEIARTNRYIQEKDKQRFIVSRAALRQITGNYTNQNPADIQFSTGENKKPYIKGYNLKYNVSHSAGWVLVGISKTDIGVDTEKIDVSFPYQSILDDNFSKEEIAFIGQSAENFFLLWTRKESLTKATGQGLDENLKHIPCLDGLQQVDDLVLFTSQNWKTNSFKLDEANWGSVVSGEDSEELKFFEL